MGEVAEMMLDGTMCEGCGVVFDDIIEGAEPPGFPRRCEACEPGDTPRRPKRRRKRERGNRP